MAQQEVRGLPEIGRIWVPEAMVSYPSNGACRPRYANVVVAGLKRLRCIDEAQYSPCIDDEDDDAATRVDEWLRGRVAPEKLTRDLVYASVSHNERVDMGASLQHNAIFQTTGTTTVTLPVTYVAIASASITATANHTSIGATGTVTASEYTGSGMARSNASITTVYTAPASLNAVATTTIAHTFAVVAPAGTAYGSGLFDNTVASGTSHMYAEVNFTEGSAVTAASDSLVVTWSIAT